MMSTGMAFLWLAYQKVLNGFIVIFADFLEGSCRNMELSTISFCKPEPIHALYETT